SMKASCSASVSLLNSRRNCASSSCVGIHRPRIVRCQASIRPLDALLAHTQVPQPVVGLVVAGITVAVAQLLNPLCEQGVECLAPRCGRLREGVVLLVSELNDFAHAVSSSRLLHVTHRDSISHPCLHHTSVQ